jgi:hypothetical protein
VETDLAVLARTGPTALADSADPAFRPRPTLRSDLDAEASSTRSYSLS